MRTTFFGRLLLMLGALLVLARRQRGAVTVTLFGREPALWLAAIAAGLGLLVTFQLPWMSADQAGLWVAGVNAAFGVAAAVLVRPVAPAAFTTLFSAGGALLLAYGVDVPPETLGAVNTLVVAVLFFITREQVTPVHDPRSIATGV